MAHFARLDDNDIVVEVHVVANDALDPNKEEQSGIEFLTEWSGGETRWVQCSYNGSFRKNYPGAGWFYDRTRDAFISPKPEGDYCEFDENTCRWVLREEFRQTV